MKPYRMLPMGAALLALGLGVVSAAPSPAGASDKGSGTNFMWKTQDAQEDRDSKDRDSNAGYLGVQVQRLTAALRRAKGIPGSTEGTLVSNVEDHGPADDAGIKRGDVIVKLNHEPTPDPSDLVQTVRGLDPGRKVPVQIWRDGAVRTVSVTVGSRPEGSDMPPMPGMPNWGGPGDSRDTPPDQPRIQIMRRNRDDLERQVQDLQEQIARLRNEDLARLEREIRELRQQLDRRDRNNDRNRNEDRDEENNEGD